MSLCCLSTGECDLAVENGCFDETSTGPTQCYTHEQRCDNITQCLNGFDESKCCNYNDMFGCYVNGSGPDGVSTYQCLYGKSRCDGYEDCADGSDEQGCKSGSKCNDL